jgi:hypothetical protein
MSEFKFICPSCRQKIKVDLAASGREFACPGCQTELLVPAAPDNAGQLPTATVVQVKKRMPGGDASSYGMKKTSKVEHPDSGATLIPRTPAKNGTRNRASSAPALEQGPAKVKLVGTTTKKPIEKATVGSIPTETATSQEQQLQIASLTPAIKRDMVRSIRLRIADEAHWMPRINPEGQYAYAAKDVEGKPVPVEVTGPEATRFSILGAALAELHLRNVTRTASGRAEFLDQELAEAIRQAAGDAIGEQEAGPGEPSARDKPAAPISHAQSLKALDLLEERYAREIEETTGSVRGRPEDLRIEHLKRKLERKEPITIEEICATLINELKEMNERLTALEHFTSGLRIDKAV